jgi:hypothetical protein
VALAGFLLAGCDAGPLRNLAGGTSSKDKQPIPPAVNAAAVPGPQTAAPTNLAVQGPAVADKAAAVAPSPPEDPRQPLRGTSEEYKAGQERDPFLSLVGGERKRTDLVDLGVVRLVAVVTSGEQPFCVVEDPEKVSYVLRVGDPVRNGRVVGIRPEALVCSQTVLGYTTTVQLKLEERKDVRNG